MSFWTENNFEPKRAFRFKMNLGYGEFDESIPYFYLKNAKKPSFEVATTTHKVAGREFNFPGSIKWMDTTVTLIDDTDNSVLKKLVSVIQESNYPDILTVDGQGNVSFTANGQLKFISKEKSSKSLTGIRQDGATSFFTVEQLDAEGNIVEAWHMYNPFIYKMEQSDVDYDKEDLNTITLTMKYDWASFEDLAR